MGHLGAVKRLFVGTVLLTLGFTGCSSDGLKSGLFGYGAGDFPTDELEAQLEDEHPRVVDATVEVGIDGLGTGADVLLTSDSADPFTVAELQLVIEMFAEHQNVKTNGFSLQVDHQPGPAAKEGDSGLVDLDEAAAEAYPCEPASGDDRAVCDDETGSRFSRTWRPGSLQVDQEAVDAYR